MKDYADWDLVEFSSWLQENGEKSFHAKQVFDWIFHKGVLSFQSMTNLSKELQEKLSKIMRLPVLKPLKMIASEDGETFKFLWALEGDKTIESVLICSGSRRTVCVSSQVGCPVRCAFCASGRQGFFRNLHPSEIVEQVIRINQWLDAKGERVSHVVFMGMGEPLKNTKSVISAIRLLSHPDFFNISPRRITVSTVGIVEGIQQLIKEGLKVNLVFSLHAPNQEIRKKIIPYARKYPLEDILAALDTYASKTKRDITYEYILIKGINDHPDHALELAHLLKGKQCTVNLIPYNPVPGVKLQRPEKKAIKDFRSVLFGSHINNTCRYTKGVDIAAACGQLALQEKESHAV